MYRLFWTYVLNFLQFVAGSGIVVLYGDSMLNFQRKNQTGFYSPTSNVGSFQLLSNMANTCYWIGLLSCCIVTVINVPWIQVLYHWFANIFSYSMVSGFTFLVAFVETQKFLFLMKSNIYFSLDTCGFGCHIQQVTAWSKDVKMCIYVF